MEAPEHLPPLPPGERGVVTFALAMATFMQVLDTSIANVAIPAISGDLGVSPTQGTWVITSFAVSNAITVPLTGWLARRFGEVRLFTAAIVLFTIASWACGLSTSMGMLIAFRVLQGAVAGPMIPLSQTLLMKAYPQEKHGTALALWSMTTLVAPICGPILGGWLTDAISWPWIFYINVPVGALCSWLCWTRLRHRETRTMKLPIDMVGLALLIIGVGCLQFLLDKGKELDWFQNNLIISLAIIAAVALVALVLWELSEKHPVIDLTLFARRNFSAATISLSLGYMVFFGSVVLLPLWLQTQVGYTATWAGLAAAPTGILAVVLSPWVGKNIRKWDPRILATLAFLIFAMTSFWRSQLNTGAPFIDIALPQFVQGAAMAMFFIPLITVALAGLPPDRIASASGLSNFVRILAGSFGASLSTTLWERRAALHHSQLTEQVTALSAQSGSALQNLQGLGLPTPQGLALLERTISIEASTLGALDIFWMCGWILLALIPLVWLTTRPKGAPSGPVAVE